MAPLAVHIKHAGKVYDLSLDPALPPTVFKDAVYHATGVPVDRMKVMVKGGVLKVDPSLSCPISTQVLSKGRLVMAKNWSQGWANFHGHWSRW